MEALTPYELEIMRLWGVIRCLQQWKGFNMNDREEAIFGEVYQAFKKLPQMPRTAAPYGESGAVLRQDLVQTAARNLRALYDLGEGQ